MVGESAKERKRVQALVKTGVPTPDELTTSGSMLDKTKSEDRNLVREMIAKHESDIEGSPSGTSGGGVNGVLGELNQVKGDIGVEKANTPNPIPAPSVKKAVATNTVEEVPEEDNLSSLKNLLNYFDGDKIRNGLSVLSEAMMKRKGGGQIVDGHFVPNSGGIAGLGLEEVPSVLEGRRKAEMQKEAMDLQRQEYADKREDRKQDVAYRNQILNQKQGDKQAIKQLQDQATVDVLQNLSRALQHSRNAGNSYQGVSTVGKMIDKGISYTPIVGNMLNGVDERQSYEDYEQIMDNQIYPRLKEILGGQFTQAQEKGLMNTLKSKTATTAEREKAVLDLANQVLAKRGMGRINSVDELISMDSLPNPYELTGMQDVGSSR